MDMWMPWEHVEVGEPPWGMVLSIFLNMAVHLGMPGWLAPASRDCTVCLLPHPFSSGGKGTTPQTHEGPYPK